MQDRIDKILKQKLDGIQPDFNPRHWSDMEAMLDGKGKKGIVWWIPSLLIFAFLTAGALGYYFYSQQGQGHDSKVSGLTVEENKPLNISQIENPESVGAKDKNSTPNSIDNESGSGFTKNKESSEKPVKVADSGADKDITQKVSDPVRKDAVDVATTVEKPKVVTNDYEEAHSSNKLLASSAAANTVAETSALTSSTSRSIQSDPLSILETDITLTKNVVYKRETPLEIASLNTISIEYVTSPNNLEQDMTTVSEDDELIIPKSKSISFSIGLVTGLSESFIDKTRFSEPGYTVGIKAEIMYKNIIGLSSGLNYTKINYGTKNVICEDNARYVCPLAYKSGINSLEVPIDLRLNFLRIKRWNFYVSTGISNFIKLEESFGYDLPLQDTIPAQLPPSRNVPFNQSNLSALTDQGIYEGTSTDFSLSDVKRYHLNYHAAIGAEYRLSKRMSLAIQPNFGFSVKQVGIQDKRLFTYGANGKFNFIF